MDTVECNTCGREFKGQRGLSIHKAKSSCGYSTNSYCSSVSRYSTLSNVEMAECNTCGREFKGQLGLSIHKAKSSCGSSSNSSCSSSAYSSMSSASIISCSTCGKECKGQLGLSIHKAKSSCGSSSNSSCSSSAYSSMSSASIISCSTCGKECKGQLGLSIHKAKSSCGSSSNSSCSSSSEYSSMSSSNTSRNELKRNCNFPYHRTKNFTGYSSPHFPGTSLDSLSIISELDNDWGEPFEDEDLTISKIPESDKTNQSCNEKNFDLCEQWLNNLEKPDLNAHSYLPIYNPKEHLESRNVRKLPDNFNESSQSDSWPEIGVNFKEGTISEEEIYYQNLINEMPKRPNNWRLNMKTFAERLSFIFKKNLYSDIKFEINYENESIVVLNGHKFIFALVSPVFYTMFYGPLLMDSKMVIKDVSPRAFQNMLTYIYTNKVSMDNINDAINIYYTSKKYKVYKLEKECDEFISNKLNDKNVFYIFEFSIAMKLKKLQEKCKEIMNQNPEVYLRSQQFLTLNLESIIIIIHEWFLTSNISKELLANKLAEWAATECNVTEVHVTIENLKNLLQPVLDGIDSESFSILVKNAIFRHVFSV
ncbi:uncharacterized protein LOC111642298 isoform X2 [Centruroides sculpturatus]|uniref:uncharacterized protein LOC111642298 isoform X2 n=1 Tax=Centruroides sculpturatus TaxID=218467 RepID=UPI000C6E2F81|nr:uncharacterized protein LOC111642298 isoform X2 [Centruroides sculpturatus]